jgi:two-component system, cell cycle sensor histidine kinase and response regulator CckA
MRSMSCTESCELPGKNVCPLVAEIGHAQRLQGLGLMLGEVVHDLRNLLALGMGHADLVLEEMREADPVLRDRISLIKDALSDCGDLCRSLLVYAGRSTGADTVFSLPNLLHELTSLLRVKVPRDVHFDVRNVFDVSLLRGDASIVRQIVVNLVLNAVEALDRDRQGQVVLDVSSARKDVDFDNGDCLLKITVSDNGCGMPPETLKRLGDPFFTTKLTGRGLGLAAVRQLVAGVAGSFAVESAVGAGSVFTITLPLRSGDDRVLDAGQAVSVESGVTGGMVLMVDDEEGLLLVHGSILERKGFRVLRATSYDDALVQFRQYREEIGLVILDMLLGGSDGATLSGALRAIRSDLPIIVLSGCSEQSIQGGFDEGAEPVEVLFKPVDAQQLRAAALRWFRLLPLRQEV